MEGHKSKNIWAAQVGSGAVKKKKKKDMEVVWEEKGGIWEYVGEGDEVNMVGLYEILEELIKWRAFIIEELLSISIPLYNDGKVMSA